MAVVVGVTFTLVTQLFYALNTLPVFLPATGGILRCSQTCLANADCGGFIWDKQMSTSCQLVVDPSVAGSAPVTATRAYRRMHYQGKKIVEPPNDQMYSWDSLVSGCAEVSGKIIDYPKTKQEKAIILIRGCERLFVDLNNKENPNTSTYKNKDGTVADLSLTQWYQPDTDLGTEQCVLVKYSPNQYFDLWCDFKYTTLTKACGLCTVE